MDPIEQLKRFIEQSHQIVVFTGAGISTESGISDYRSQGGIWQRFQPVTIQEFMAEEDKRKLYWQRKLSLFEENKDAEPNLGHKAIVELERQGKSRAIKATPIKFSIFFIDQVSPCHNAFLSPIIKHVFLLSCM